MAPFWEIGASLVYRMFSPYRVYLLFYLFLFSFEGMSLVLIVPVPGH